MNKYIKDITILFLILCVFCITLVGILFSPSFSSSVLAKQNVGHITLNRFFQQSKSLDSVTISIPLHTSLKKPLYFTVFLDVNGNTTFGNNELAVKDIPAPVEHRLPNNFPLHFANDDQLEKLLSMPDGTTLKTKIIVTDGIHKLFTTIVNAKIQNIDVGPVFNPQTGLTGVTAVDTASDYNFPLEAFFVPKSVFAASAVPVFHDNVPDLKGRKGKPNECVPVSLANSLIWLASVHNFKNKLPVDTDGLLDELDTLLKWDKNGTANDNILPGKQAFTTNHELLLENKKIDGNTVNGQSNMWGKIVKELNDGEDVELILDFKETPNGKATKGHAVTVVGADNTASAGQTLTFHDPATPGGNDTYQVAKNGQIKNYPLGKVFGNFIISESFVGPTSSPTPTPSESPTPFPSPSPKK